MVTYSLSRIKKPTYYQSNSHCASYKYACLKTSGTEICFLLVGESCHTSSPVWSTDSLLQPKSLWLDASLNKKVMDVLREMKCVCICVCVCFKSREYRTVGKKPNAWLKDGDKPLSSVILSYFVLTPSNLLLQSGFSIVKANARNSWFIFLCRISVVTTCKHVYLGTILLHNLWTSVKSQWLVFRKQQLCW